VSEPLSKHWLNIIYPVAKLLYTQRLNSCSTFIYTCLNVYLLIVSTFVYLLPKLLSKHCLNSYLFIAKTLLPVARLHILLMLELLYTHCLNLYLNKAKTFGNHYRTLIYQVPDFCWSTRYLNFYLPIIFTLICPLPEPLSIHCQNSSSRCQKLLTSKWRNFHLPKAETLHIRCLYLYLHLSQNQLIVWLSEKDWTLCTLIYTLFELLSTQCLNSNLPAVNLFYY